jgi:hypothetical protein
VLATRWLQQFPLDPQAAYHAQYTVTWCLGHPEGTRFRLETYIGQRAHKQRTITGSVTLHDSGALEMWAQRNNIWRTDTYFAHKIRRRLIFVRLPKLRSIFFLLHYLCLSFVLSHTMELTAVSTGVQELFCVLLFNVDTQTLTLTTAGDATRVWYVNPFVLEAQVQYAGSEHAMKQGEGKRSLAVTL